MSLWIFLFLHNLWTTIQPTIFGGDCLASLLPNPKKWKVDICLFDNWLAKRLGVYIHFNICLQTSIHFTGSFLIKKATLKDSNIKNQITVQIHLFNPQLIRNSLLYASITIHLTKQPYLCLISWVTCRLHLGPNCNIWFHNARNYKWEKVNILLVLFTRKTLNPLSLLMMQAIYKYRKG